MLIATQGIEDHPRRRERIRLRLQARVEQTLHDLAHVRRRRRATYHRGELRLLRIRGLQAAEHCLRLNSMFIMS